MDDRRFDALTRALGRGGSRRTALKALLGFGGVAAAGAILHETDAARRGSSGPPTPSPLPTQPLPPPPPATETIVPTAPAPPPTETAVPKCPGNQTPCGADCCCPTGTTKCGADCCPDGQAGCCDGACCFGTCYGEELCCPTGLPICSVDGCCHDGRCVDQGQFCCPDANVCGDNCCPVPERCCEVGGASVCRDCCADADCSGARCIDGSCVPFTPTSTNTPTDTPTSTPTVTPTDTSTPTVTMTPTTVLTPELSKIYFSYIPYGGDGCCFCSARVELLGVQPNWNYEADLYVWDGPGNPEPTTSVESQEMTTDDNGVALVAFNTNINNDGNSSSAQWAKVIVNGVATDWLQASCENFPTSVPTITPTPTSTSTPTSTPTPTHTPTPIPTATPPSSLTVKVGLMTFASLQTCQVQTEINGGQPSTTYQAALFVWDGPGHPEPAQPVETIDVTTFGNGQGFGTYHTLVANNTGQYAQVVVLGVGSGWNAVSPATCEP